MKARLLLLLGTLALIAALGEVGARLLFEAPPIWRLPQTRHLRSPLLGWVLPPSTQSFTIDAPVSVNALGLRDDEIPLRKPEGEHRVLALGDSFTFALGVRFEDLYVQQLERILAERHPRDRFQVINAGVAGYNTRQELIYLRTQGLDLEPDLVTLGFYWNDLIGNEAALPDLESTPRIDPEENWHDPEFGHAIPSFLRDRLRQSVLLYQLVIRAKSAIARFDPPQHDYARVQRALLAGDAELLEPFWAATAARLREIAEAAGEHDVPVVLVAFPMENQIRFDYSDIAWGSKLEEIWRPTGLPFVDLEPAYREALEARRNPFLPYDLHPNALGMQIAAEALYEAIRDAGYLRLSGGESISR